MTIDRRQFGTTLAAAFAAGLLPGRAVASSRSVLEAELARHRCGPEADALRGTLSRLARSRPPGPSGSTIVVDLPSQYLAAYRNGRVVLESRVVVGDDGWRTPDLETAVSYVRFNPTWTVPESIVASRNWRTKLATQPGFFETRNFDVEVDGRLVDPVAASPAADRARRFVQRPGPGNALGRVKLALAAGGSVYLHDTAEPEGYEDDGRAFSHGCVRVEKAMELAAFALGMPTDEAKSLLMADDRTERRPPVPVRVVTTYFTAWPDGSGTVRYYPDVYGRDARGACQGT